MEKCGLGVHVGAWVPRAHSVRNAARRRRAWHLGGESLRPLVQLRAQRARFHRVPRVVRKRAPLLSAV